MTLKACMKSVTLNPDPILVAIFSIWSSPSDQPIILLNATASVLFPNKKLLRNHLKKFSLKHMLCFRRNIMVFHPAALSPLNEFGFSDALDYGWIQTLFQWILKSFYFGISLHRIRHQNWIRNRKKEVTWPLDFWEKNFTILSFRVAIPKSKPFRTHRNKVWIQPMGVWWRSYN